MTDVVLVSMPFADLPRPSPALSLLQAILHREGISCRVLYGSFRFARQLGLQEYQRFVGGRWEDHSFGELVFSRCLFPEHPLDWQILARVRRRGRAPEASPTSAETDRARLERLAAAADQHLEEMAQAVLDLRPRILGCTSTFEQHLASLALFTRVRRREPGIVTMLGGSNCEAEMGVATHRLFPQVDFVVSGEADGLLAPLCRSLLEGRVGEVPEGVLAPIHRSSGYPQPAPRAVYHDLDSLPMPDHADFFRELEGSGLAHRLEVALPLQTSRGCWWGQRSQCAFCGLNGLGLGYRTRSPELVVQELEQMADSAGLYRFQLVDNILDMRAFATWLPRLAASGRPWNLFAEVKSNLGERHVRLLAAAGMRWLQPGIESLDSRLLALMRKGARAWQQVQLLKLAREHGLYLVWNLLVGFPGEEDHWHAETARLLPSLHHLQPPVSLTPIRFDRFSPYFRRASELALDLQPHPLSALCYPFPEEDRAALSSHFERRDRPLDGRCPGPGHEALAKAVRAWYEAFHPAAPTLWMHDRDGRLAVTDTRPVADRPEFELEGLPRAVLLAASEGRTLDALACECAGWLGRQPEASELRATLEELEARRLVVGLDGRWLSLGLREATPPWPPGERFAGGGMLPAWAFDAREQAFRSLFALP